jgi:hypothetical protein
MESALLTLTLVRISSNLLDAKRAKHHRMSVKVEQCEEEIARQQNFARSGTCVLVRARVT